MAKVPGKRKRKKKSAPPRRGGVVRRALGKIKRKFSRKGKASRGKAGRSSD